MAIDKKQKDHIYDETIDKAVKTGFLFDLSINFYENHTHEELIDKGYSEVQVACANKVLDHFNTSVGAKLGLCEPELWCVRPCADCGKSVDNRKFNTFPIYGAFLCKACKLARDAPRRCIDCSNKYHDPSLDAFVADPLVQRNSRFRGMPYICSWCALLRGDCTFVEERTPREDRDKKILTSQMGLVNPRKFGFPTSEELERERTELPEVEWLFLPRQQKDIKDKLLYFKGEDVADRGKGFFIRYTGYVWRKYQEPLPANSIDSPYFLIDHPNDPCKIVMISRVQYFHRECQGYVETFWEPWPRSLDFRNVNPKRIKRETKILLQVAPLIFRLEREYRGGRPPAIPEDLETIYAHYLYLCACHIYLDSDDARPIGKDLADFYGKHRSTLHRHLERNFEKTFSDVKSACEARVQPIPIEDLPEKFRSYIERKRSERITTDTLP